MENKMEAVSLIQSEEKKPLEEKNHLLEMILDQIDAFIYVKDNNGTYIYANQNYRDLYHISAKDLMNTSDFDFLDLDSAINKRFNEQEVLMRGEPEKFEEEIQIDGQLRHFISYIMPLDNDCICNFATEVTNFK